MLVGLLSIMVSQIYFLALHPIVRSKARLIVVPLRTQRTHRSNLTIRLHHLLLVPHLLLLLSIERRCFIDLTAY